MNDQEIEQKQDVADDHLPTWIKKTLEEAGVTPNKESFGACLRPMNCSRNQENIDTSCIASFKVVFSGIPGICEPQTIEMKIPRSQNPKESGLSMTYEEYTFPTTEY